MLTVTTLLSRLQFAFTVSFHILFPAFSIGLALFLAIMEGIWLKNQDPKYLAICKFWTKIFALTFGMGIVSGIVMEFQFGTNWAGFANSVGPILGALFTYEVLTAFFIEAGFLGVMLFGWGRVGKKLHYFATLLVVIGTTISAFWILSANSWMQTPAGFVKQGSKWVVDNWMAVIFNPSVIPRFIHMLLAAYITTAFTIAGISAYYLLKKRSQAVAKTCFSFALAALVILVPLQIIMGDSVGRTIFKYQPVKTAAMEGLWHTESGAPFLIFAIPSMTEEKNYFEIKVPHAAALINTHAWNGTINGLTAVAATDRPYVPLVFFSFRIMVYIGFLMLFIAVVGLWYRYRKTLYDKNWFLRLCVLSSPLGFIALWCGWITAETGRQPWAVYGLLRTSEAASPVDTYHVLVAFILIILVYGIVFGFFYFHYLLKLIRKGPEHAEPELEEQPFKYLSGVPEQKP